MPRRARVGWPARLLLLFACASAAAVPDAQSLSQPRSSLPPRGRSGAAPRSQASPKQPSPTLSSQPLPQAEVASIGSRRLQACGFACLAPKIDPAAVASAPVLIEVTFSAPYALYAAPQGTYGMAYGICYVLGCNYRNVVLTLATSDAVGKKDVVYSVVFYNPAGSSNITFFGIRSSYL